MNKKSNRVPSAGTKAEKSTNDETRLPSSPTIGNTHVVRSPNVVSTEKLWVVIPNVGTPIELTSKGLVFFFQDGSSINILTADLIEHLNSRIGDYMNPKFQVEHRYKIFGKSYFPKDFFK